VKQRAVFLDRDGTIIVEKHYLKDPSQVELLEGACEGLRLLQRMGFKLVIVTNQSGLKRGLFTVQDLENIHQRLTALLDECGVGIDGIYYSPDLPEEASKKRKPGTGLVEQAARELHLSFRGSYCIGDKHEDIEMGRRKKMKTVLVLTGYGTDVKALVEPTHAAKDLLDAARWIQKQEEA
jgi:D-glycero-D-manno-heptose 1,7-bisphosphate phosphatase